MSARESLVFVDARAADWSTIKRTEFDCGVEALNDYLLRFARQNERKNLARTVLALDHDHIAGYYTLGAGQLSRGELAPDSAQRLPNYPVPTIRLQRLAVSTRYQGRSIGKRLVGHAIHKALRVSEAIGVFAMEVDAKDEPAAAFYRHLGFETCESTGLKLYLSLKAARQEVERLSLIRGGSASHS